MPRMQLNVGVNNFTTNPQGLSLASNDYIQGNRLYTGVAQLNSEWSDEFSTEVRGFYKDYVRTQAPVLGHWFRPVPGLRRADVGSDRRRGCRPHPPPPPAPPAASISARISRARPTSSPAIRGAGSCRRGSTITITTCASSPTCSGPRCSTRSCSVPPAIIISTRSPISPPATRNASATAMRSRRSPRTMPPPSSTTWPIRSAFRIIGA